VQSASNTPPSSPPIRAYQVGWPAIPLVRVDAEVIWVDSIDRRPTTPLRALGSPIWIDSVERVPIVPISLVRAPQTSICVDQADQTPTTPIRALKSPIWIDSVPRVPISPVQAPLAPIQVNRLLLSPLKVQRKNKVPSPPPVPQTSLPWSGISFDAVSYELYNNPWA
jgi:hypothetical protein